MKIFIKLINYLFMPRVDGIYVSDRLSGAASLHGITIGESSLSFREYDPIAEYRYPIKGSESTENHIKFKDIALIVERCSHWEIALWNGYIYTLLKDRPLKTVSDSFRDVENMSYFALRRPVTPKEIIRNMDL